MILWLTCMVEGSRRNWFRHTLFFLIKMKFPTSLSSHITHCWHWSG